MGDGLISVCMCKLTCWHPCVCLCNCRSISRVLTYLCVFQRGTALLLEHLAGSLASSVLVSTQLDIAPQHHNFLLGRNGANVKNISQRTGAHIHFPELNTHNTHTSRSAVYIQGSIDAVCAARQQLMVWQQFVSIFSIQAYAL